MQFITDNEYFKVARITGSFHNLLSIKLSKTLCPITIIGVSNTHNKTVNKLDGSKVLKFVLLGLVQANARYEKNYFISEVQYVVSDTTPYEIYQLMTKELIHRIALNQEFIFAPRKQLFVIDTFTTTIEQFIHKQPK